MAINQQQKNNVNVNKIRNSTPGKHPYFGCACMGISKITSLVSQRRGDAQHRLRIPCVFHSQAGPLAAPSQCAMLPNGAKLARAASLGNQAAKQDKTRREAGREGWGWTGERRAAGERGTSGDGGGRGRGAEWGGGQSRRRKNPESLTDSDRVHAHFSSPEL